MVSLFIESGEVLKAIETAIPPETIEQVLGQTESRETRKHFTAITPGSPFGNCDEYMVIRFNKLLSI